MVILLPDFLAHTLPWPPGVGYAHPAAQAWRPIKPPNTRCLIGLCWAVLSRQRFAHLQPGVPVARGALAARRGAVAAGDLALIAVLPSFIADPRP
jgi:hypothetical protein